MAVGGVGYLFSLLSEEHASLLGGSQVLKQKFEDGNERNRFDWT